ncbi:MAG: DUF4249 family protein [Bacteroidota bacterium]
MKKAWLYIGILLLTACAKKADWQEPEMNSALIIVDGIITTESKEQYIHIHYNKAELNGELVPLSGAEVIINNEDSTWQLYEDPGEEGKYISAGVFAAQLGKSYSLLILYQEQIYSAQAAMVAGKTFPELIYKENENDDLYHISYVASAFEEEDPAMWEILLDWSEVPGYENTDPNQAKKRLLFYTLTTLDVSQIFAPLVEQVFFPAGTRIDQKRYSLSDEHADFIRSLLLETSWQGGVFPNDPANVLTNISEGALGFFGVCAVNSLSLTVAP